MGRSHAYSPPRVPHCLAAVAQAQGTQKPRVLLEQSRGSNGCPSWATCGHRAPQSPPAPKPLTERSALFHGPGFPRRREKVSKCLMD